MDTLLAPMIQLPEDSGIQPPGPLQSKREAFARPGEPFFSEEKQFSS